MFQAKVIEDSISTRGVRLTTLQLQYPRFIHAEFMTHRMFSRNASSSRAIPVPKMVEQVRKNPATPIHWGKNQSGMQAREELEDDLKREAQLVWQFAAEFAATQASVMHRLGAHKQIVNRILEPFQWIHVVVTATEWDNFFKQRRHTDAQPEIQHLSDLMWDALEYSEPRLVEPVRFFDRVENWHLPYVTRDERQGMPLELLRKASVARCARVSYLTHDGVAPDIKKDLELYDRLVGSVPLHASPTEHQATPDPYYFQNFHRNLRGWMPLRVSVEAQIATQEKAA